MIVWLIGHTRTKTGLTIQVDLDTQSYETRQQADPEEVPRLCIWRPEHQNPLWNYTIRATRVNPDEDELVGYNFIAS